jgi:hypothetical protein
VRYLSTLPDFNLRYSLTHVSINGFSVSRALQTNAVIHKKKYCFDFLQILAISKFGIHLKNIAKSKV